MNSDFLRLPAKALLTALLVTGCNSQVFVSDDDLPPQPEDFALWPEENVRIDLESPAPEALILSGLGNLHASVWIPGDSVASVIDTEEPIAPFGARLECVSRQMDIKIEAADTSSASPAITVSLNKWYVPKESTAQLTVCYAYSRQTFNFTIPACPPYMLGDLRFTSPWEVDSVASSTHKIVDQLTVKNEGPDSIKFDVYPYKNACVTALFRPSDDTPKLPVDSDSFLITDVPLPSGDKSPYTTNRFYISYLPKGDVIKEDEGDFVLPDEVRAIKATITVPPVSHRTYYLFMGYQVKSAQYEISTYNTEWSHLYPVFLTGRLTVSIPYDFIVAYTNI